MRFPLPQRVTVILKNISFAALVVDFLLQFNTSKQGTSPDIAKIFKYDCFLFV